MKTRRALLLASFLGIVSFTGGCAKSTSPASAKPASAGDTGHDHYTCRMHPSVNSAAPGKCPVCGMDLVPTKKS